MARPLVFRGWRRLATGILLILAPTAPLVAQSSDNEAAPQVQQLYAQAQAAQQQGDAAAAIAKYREMIRLAPHLAAAYNNLGMLYFNQHDYAQASTVLEHGLKLNPNMPTASALLGLSYFELGEDEKAEPLLERAARANPTDDNVQMGAGPRAAESGQERRGDAVPECVSEPNPKDQEALYLLGKTYLQLSEEALGKINQIDPNSYVAHEVAGEIDESMHNYDGALVEYKKAIDQAPQQPGRICAWRMSIGSIGKWDTARDGVSQRSWRIDPNDCTARWKLANSILEANGSSRMRRWRI